MKIPLVDFLLQFNTPNFYESADCGSDEDGVGSVFTFQTDANGDAKRVCVLLY